MGFLTTFTIYNDGCDVLKRYPEKLADILYNACSIEFIKANGSNQVGLGCYANLITVQKPQHADSRTLYLHFGNIVTDINNISEKNNPMIDNAIDEMELQIKKLRKLKDDL